MFAQMIRLFTPRSSKRRPASPCRVRLQLETLEDRCTPSTTTAFSGGTLTLTINTGDAVTITENVLTPSGFSFTVADSTTTAIAGKGAGPFTNVKNITVNISKTNANLLVVGPDLNPGGVQGFDKHGKPVTQTGGKQIGPRMAFEVFRGKRTATRHECKVKRVGDIGRAAEIGNHCLDKRLGLRVQRLTHAQTVKPVCNRGGQR